MCDMYTWLCVYPQTYESECSYSSEEMEQFQTEVKQLQTQMKQLKVNLLSLHIYLYTLNNTLIEA